MRRIDLDYRPRKSRWGRLLFGAGILVAGMTVVAYLSLTDEAARWRQAEQRSGQETAMSADGEDARGDHQRLQQEIDEANAAIGRLSLPWNELFRGIEDATIDRVALLSVQPQPQQYLVNLNGEARVYADVLAYMGRLDSSGAFSRTRLLSHKVRSDDPRHPVSFAIAAGWRIEP
jgi:Tfp pilus assembly protein PilN